MAGCLCKCLYSSLGISSFSSLYSLSRRRAAEGGGDLMAEVVYRPTGLVSDKPMTARMAEAGISFKSGHTQVKFGIIKDSNQKGDFIVKRFSNTLKKNKLLH